MYRRYSEPQDYPIFVVGWWQTITPEYIYLLCKIDKFLILEWNIIWKLFLSIYIFFNVSDMSFSRFLLACASLFPLLLSISYYKLLFKNYWINIYSKRYPLFCIKPYTGWLGQFLLALLFGKWLELFIPCFEGHLMLF